MTSNLDANRLLSAYGGLRRLDARTVAVRFGTCAVLATRCPIRKDWPDPAPDRDGAQSVRSGRLSGNHLLHGMLEPTSFSGQVRIDRLRFGGGPQVGTRCVDLRGHLSALGSGFPFSIRAHHIPAENHWTTRADTLRWRSPVPASFMSQDNLLAITRTVIAALRPTWLKPISGGGGEGAALQVGQAKMSGDDLEQSLLVARFELLGLARPEWSSMWDGITERARWDPELRVHGMPAERIRRAVPILRRLFPVDWVRREYRDESPDRSAAGMWSDYEPDVFFPAYHLARTGLGATCKDPGWNYVIALAEAIDMLRTAPGGQRLISELPRSSGAVHHAVFAKYLADCGRLVELNPGTGSGNDTHDLSARADDGLQDYELKTVSSARPGPKIANEIRSRIPRLPARPPRPIVILTLLVPKNQAAIGSTLEEYLGTIEDSCFAGSSKISAVVAGAAFVDASGGDIKWRFDKFVRNSAAANPVTEESLRSVCAQNWTRVAYPAFPIFMKYGLTANQPEPFRSTG